MMRKYLLLLALITLACYAAKGQTMPRDTGVKYNRCGTPVPSDEWNAWFNQQVEVYKKQLTNTRGAGIPTYVIPIVFHVIYGNEPEDSFPNISQQQINSQVEVLNADYAGKGYNTNIYAALDSNKHLKRTPFYDYAKANNLPAPDDSGVVIGNTGISFCMAIIDPSGNTLAEPGIDRVSYVTKGWKDPASFLSISSFQTYMDNTIKPNTIWDPTRYFNVWLTDINYYVGVIGYSTFPSGTGLTGLSGGGSTLATPTTDGCWVWAKTCGDTGTVYPPYNLGRTLTHESGHYFGLRHVWGDGDCATDYCNDVPPASAPNYVPWPTTYPYLSSTCIDTGNYNSNGKDGQMFMNFMDYTEDAAMWMFTNDQITRMRAALTQSPDRIGLTTASNTLCSSSAPVAAFTSPASSLCAGHSLSFKDASSGYTTNWHWRVTPSIGVSINADSSANPAINFKDSGKYIVTLFVSNPTGVDSSVHVIIVDKCMKTDTNPPVPLPYSAILYPNPNYGIMYLKVTLPNTSDLHVNITDVLGQSVFVSDEKNVSSATLTYSLTALSKGLYFITITDSYGHKTMKKLLLSDALR